MDLSHSKKITTAGLLITLGIIFGDIGTSPLYTFQTIMTEGGKVTEELVLGAISCVFWTLTLQTTFKYVFITLNADNKGEGGVFSLYALVRRYGKKLMYPAIIGAGTLLADGIITPPISVTSAIEGLGSVHGLETTIVPGNALVVEIVLVILLLLFVFQLIEGLGVIGDPGNAGDVDTIAILVVCCFFIGIARAWELIGAPSIGIGHEVTSLVRAHGRGDPRDEQPSAPP